MGSPHPTPEAAGSAFVGRHHVLESQSWLLVEEASTDVL